MKRHNTIPPSFLEKYKTYLKKCKKDKIEPVSKLEFVEKLREQNRKSQRKFLSKEQNLNKYLCWRGQIEERKFVTKEKFENFYNKAIKDKLGRINSKNKKTRELYKKLITEI